MLAQFPNYIHVFWYINIDFDNSISAALFQKVLVMFQDGMKTNANVLWNGVALAVTHSTICVNKVYYT